MIVSYSGNAHGETLTNYTTYSKTKFTVEHNSNELVFLDIFIRNENGQIITDIYPQTPNNTSTSIATILKTA